MRLATAMVHGPTAASGRKHAPAARVARHALHLLRPAMPSIEAFLREMVERGASDLHLTTASPPMIRLHGELDAIAHPPLTASDTKNLCYSLLTEAQKKRFEEESELDFSFGIQRRRPLPRQPLQPEGLRRRGVPHDPASDAAAASARAAGVGHRDDASCRAASCSSPGPRAAAESTTLAAMIDKINRERHEHIVTVEDPIEFVHEHKAAS